jgi:hypothetical protein
MTESTLPLSGNTARLCRPLHAAQHVFRPCGALDGLLSLLTALGLFHPAGAICSPLGCERRLRRSESVAFLSTEARCWMACRTAGYSVFSLWSLLCWACSLRLDVPPPSLGRCLSSAFSPYSLTLLRRIHLSPICCSGNALSRVHSCGEYARILLYSLHGLVSASPGVLPASYSLCVLSVFSSMLCRHGDALVFTRCWPSAVRSRHALLGPCCFASSPVGLLDWPQILVTRLLASERAVAGERCCRRGGVANAAVAGDRRCCCADPHRGPQYWTSGHAETAGHPSMLFPAGHPVELRFCWTLGYCFAFAGPPGCLRLPGTQSELRSTGPRLCCHAHPDSRTRRYCRHSLSLGLRPCCYC